MDLNEIETKADELAAQLIDPGTHSAVVRDVTFRLDGLSRAAQIKATAAYRREQALPDLSLAGFPRARDVAGQAKPGPTKPAADRLHELVSYCQTMYVENESGDAAEAYEDAATKLQEILSEGGI